MERSETREMNARSQREKFVLARGARQERYNIKVFYEKALLENENGEFQDISSVSIYFCVKVRSLGPFLCVSCSLPPEHGMI